MKRSDVVSAYQELTGKLSEIVRQLSFAGIALVWIFKTGSGDKPSVPSQLLWPAAWVVIALALDFLQYVYASAAWGIFNRRQERSGVGADDDFKAPAEINWPTLFFLWGKVVAVGLGYVGFLSYLRGAIFA